MPTDVFRFHDYKTLLKAKIKENATIRGYQTKLADAAKCHRSYFSQCLSKKQQLSSEQLMRLAGFWGLNALETEYLVELGHLARADFSPLQALIRERMRTLKSQSENLAKRFTESRQIDEASAMSFYSSWHIGALHMLAGLDDSFSAQALANRLAIPLPTVLAGMKVLEAMGLVTPKSGHWRSKPFHMHIPKDSPLCSINHGNWRQRAVLSSQAPVTDALHYTCVQSHGRVDFQAIKDILLQATDQTRKIVGPARNEDASCLCIDFFRL